MLNVVVAIPVFTLWFGAIVIDPTPMDWITVFLTIYSFSVYCKFKTSPKLKEEVMIPLIILLFEEFRVPVLIPTVSAFPVKSLEISSKNLMSEQGGLEKKLERLLEDKERLTKELDTVKTDRDKKLEDLKR